MIYISSSSIKGKTKIEEVLQIMFNQGFHNIELSGGTEFQEDILEVLLEQKEKLNLNFLCHNYFPAPAQHFVVNLASLNDDIHQWSMDHFKRSIDLSQGIGAKKFGLHAGFYTDIFVNQIGKNIEKRPIYDKQKSFFKFCKSFEELKKYSNGRVQLYIENNVIAEHNYINYDNFNFFMLTNAEEYFELQRHIEFDLLLDVAHLNVSANTLGLDFQQEIDTLWQQSNYIHISDNDGKKDLNWPLSKGSAIEKFVAHAPKAGKIFTMEVYAGDSEIRKTIELFDPQK